MEHLLLFGPPGCGKGTQSKLLQNDLGFRQLSTGDLLRAEIKAQSEIGKKCDAIIARGEFPDDTIIFQLVEGFIAGADTEGVSGILYDGMPRTVNQAKLLVELLRKRNESLSSIIVMEVDDEVVVDRVSSRYLCAQCGASYSSEVTPKIEGTCDYCGSHEFTKRPDDNAETIRKRLSTYKNTTLPILNYLKEQGLGVHYINADRSVHNVNKEIKAFI